MYEGIATLYAYGNRSYDRYGNEESETYSRVVYVQPRSVYNSEFYNAQQVGLHPSITLELANKEDYKGEKLVEFEGKMFDVIRTDWSAQKDKIALVLQERINVKAD